MDPKNYLKFFVYLYIYLEIVCYKHACVKTLQIYLEEINKR